MKLAKVRRTNFRPPALAPIPALERTARPVAVASPGNPHHVMLEGLSDCTILGIITDAEKRNLRNQADHETRWWAERSSAAREIRRVRKSSGQWNLNPMKP